MIENWDGQGALQLKGDGAVLQLLQWLLSSHVAHCVVRVPLIVLKSGGEI